MDRSIWFLFVALLGTMSWAHADSSEDAAKLVAVIHMNKGDSLEKQGRLADAEHEYDLALISYADAANIHLSRGRVRYQLKNYAGAIEDFNYYLSKQPDNTDVLLLRSLSKSLLKPEDVAGACADLLQIKRRGVSLEKAGIGGMDKYCRGQKDWNDN